METLPKILIIGASGTLGKLICQEVLRIFERNVIVVVGDYKHERGEALARSLGSQA